MVLGGLDVQILHQKMFIYGVHVPVKRSKTLRNSIFLFSSLCEFRLSMVDVEPRSSRFSSVEVIKWATTTLFIFMGNLDIPKKSIFPEFSKIRRNSGNPEKTEILVIRISEKSI